jgi:hypothetical protein
MDLKQRDKEVEQVRKLIRYLGLYTQSQLHVNFGPALAKLPPQANFDVLIQTCYDAPPSFDIVVPHEPVHPEPTPLPDHPRDPEERRSYMIRTGTQIRLHETLRELAEHPSLDPARQPGPRLMSQERRDQLDSLTRRMRERLAGMTPAAVALEAVVAPPADGGALPALDARRRTPGLERIVSWVRLRWECLRWLQDQRLELARAHLDLARFEYGREASPPPSFAEAERLFDDAYDLSYDLKWEWDAWQWPANLLHLMRGKVGEIRELVTNQHFSMEWNELVIFLVPVEALVRQPRSQTQSSSGPE